MELERYLRLIAGMFVLATTALGLLGTSRVVPFHCVYWFEPAAIGFYKVVSHDHVSKEARYSGEN